MTIDLSVISIIVGLFIAVSGWVAGRVGAGKKEASALTLMQKNIETTRDEINFARKQFEKFESLNENLAILVTKFDILNSFANELKEEMREFKDVKYNAERAHERINDLVSAQRNAS